MMQLFESVLNTTTQETIGPGIFAMCLLVSLGAGFLLAVMSMWRVKTSGSFLITLGVIPAAVCAIIMMVNGNIGTGAAVAGAFALVRFRSAAGSAREIGAIFAAMAVGLMTGMGCLGYAVLFTLLVGGALMLCTAMGFGEKREAPVKQLSITIPENLDYSGVFDTVLSRYAREYKLVQVKTTHMGSLFKLTYDIVLRDEAREKEMIDELRVRNGNLEIMVCFRETAPASLL